MSVIKEIWKSNLLHELMELDQSLYGNKIVVVDTEFPGFLVKSRLDSSGFFPYPTLKSNVDPTILIQLGITVLGDGGVIGSWNFNFKFDLATETSSSSGIEFLKSKGIDFQILKEKGICFGDFARIFGSIMTKHKDLTWITFHGLYDVAYLVKMVTGQSLPATRSGFLILVGEVLGSVIDLKFISEFCDWLGANLSLEKLAMNLGVERIGGAHQAGSDCLLTAHIFLAMKTLFQFDEASFQGLLYGVDGRIPNPETFEAFQPLLLPFYPPPTPSQCSTPIFNVLPFHCHSVELVEFVNPRFCSV